MLTRVVKTVTQPAFISSKLTIKKLEQGVKYVKRKQKRRQNDAIGVTGVFIVNFEHISHLVLLFLLLTLNM